VFLSQPDGTYRFEPLPRIAQISPLQGLVAGDFEGSGHAGIYAVQNSYAPIPLVGRFDGGLSQLLRGDGRGHFAPVPPAESGLVVPGDAKALAVLDHDGWPDFVVTRNNGDDDGLPQQGRPRPTVPVRSPQGAARQPNGGRREDIRQARRRDLAGERGLRGLGPLQPIRRRLLLWISRRLTPAKGRRPVADRRNERARRPGGLGRSRARPTATLTSFNAMGYEPDPVRAPAASPTGSTAG
jgi:hypothetical protein